MRSIMVSTDVFARIWSLRETGEGTEDGILRRVLGCPLPPEQGSKASGEPRPGGGVHDARNGVTFPEGFEVFRTYLGDDYKAVASGGRWLLQGDGGSYGSLNELSRRIGAKTENAWTNWFFLDPSGRRRPASDLRDPAKIASRSRSTSMATEVSAIATQKPATAVNSDGTWRDDVRVALERLGGHASLHRIYREVETVRRAAERSVPPTFEAIIRRTLEDHSSDSENYRGGLDLFRMPEGRGAGVWGLR